MELFMTYSSIKELQEALEALPLLRPSVDGLDPNKTVVACHAEHLEEAIEFYKKNLKSLPAFYILGDYSNIKADKNISLNDFAKLDNTFSVHAFTAQAKDPMFVKFRPLTMALQEQGIIKFSVERYSTENFALRNNTREFTPNYWESILNFTNLLKDNESKCAYMGAIKASILGEPEYIPIANYKQYYHPKLLPAPQDIICEGGIDNGKTTLEFFDFMQNKGKIYAFEAYKPTLENL